MPIKARDAATVLTDHVARGRLTEAVIDAKIKKGGGKDMMKTVQGEDLTFSRGVGHLRVTDVKGDEAEVTISNVMQSNGVFR
jgi:uncharacterized surface protein with fasciclin (FAS1) repeats